MTDKTAGFTEWVDQVLAGTGWSAATVRGAADRGRDDLVTAALADGFAAAAYVQARMDSGEAVRGERGVV